MVRGDQIVKKITPNWNRYLNTEIIAVEPTFKQNVRPSLHKVSEIQFRKLCIEVAWFLIYCHKWMEMHVVKGHIK